jgi:DNA mismatch repair protein MutS2
LRILRKQEKNSSTSSDGNRRGRTFIEKTSEYLSSFESSNAIPFDEYEDIESELKLMLIENYRLENSAFIKIKTITEQIGKLQKFFPTMPETFPTLMEDVSVLEFRKEIIDKVDKVFNRFGEVKVKLLLF